MPATLCSITPLLPSGPDFEAAIRFYVQEMGFVVSWQDGGMAGLERDGIAFNLVHNSERAWADNSSFSIGVTGLDALYQEYRGSSARVGALEFKAWGRREFHMVVSSGVCFQFYERAGHGEIHSKKSPAS